jgi:hypothetical protein
MNIQEIPEIITNVLNSTIFFNNVSVWVQLGLEKGRKL